MTGWLLAASAAVVIAWAAYLIATVRTRRAAATELTRTRHELPRLGGPSRAADPEPRPAGALWL